MSELEAILLFQIRCARLSMPESEYRFHPGRRWRFDFAWPDRMLAIEVEGGTYTSGRHNRAAGFAKDCEKYNEAAIAGWTVLRFTGEQVKTGEALQVVERAFATEQAIPA